jgi:steroid delta-isomerase
MADADTLRTNIASYTARFTAEDREGWLDLFDDDAWIEDPVGTPRHDGPEAIGAFFDMSSSMAESIELRQTGPVRVAAGECAFPMQARPDLGGTTFVVDIIDVLTFDDTGHITTMRAFWDPAEMRPAAD